MEVFPAHGIMQRVGARVAPVTVEIVLAKRRARAAEFVQLVGGENRDLGREDLGLGDLDGGLGHRVFAGIVKDLVDRPPRSLKQGLGGVKLHFEIADLGDGEDILVAVFLAAIDPRSDGAADEADRLLDYAARDASVDRRLNEL
jgi:hypothetical protein